MRNFTDDFGNIVDLDDPKTYKHLPTDCNQLDDMMFKEIGYAIVYMDWFYWDIFGVKPGLDQRLRVKKLITEFADNRKYHYGDVLWLQEQVYIFKNEINNMC